MNSADKTPSIPVAIVGIGCLFPKADDLAGFWSIIRNGVDAITEVPATHWNVADYYDADPKAPDHTYAKRGGFLNPVDFPALDYGIAPTNIDATDTTQLLGLMVAKAALDDAGYGGGKEFDRNRVSVILGVTGTLELVIPLGARLGHPIWRRALDDCGITGELADEVVERIAGSYVGWQENSFPGLLGNVAAGRIANRLDLGGTNCVIDAACASSLGALHLAMLELAAGRSDLVLTGGLDTFNDIFMYMCFSKTPALSPTGDAKPFDATGDGTILGEGLGVIALKRLDDARRDGDKIYAVIKGVGSSSDGKGQAVYAPVAAGQAKALRQAYEVAGVSPSTIELVEAHGTGTKVGDATELKALADVYGSAGREGSWCAVGSVKSQIGHTKAAAGAAGLIKAALALHHKVIPPTAKVTNPTEILVEGNSPFYPNVQARPWMPSPDHPRRAAVSAFGFGGSNFHCVLEEADPAPAEVAWDGATQLVAFSAPSRDQLKQALAAFPTTPTFAELRRAAAKSRAGFDTKDSERLVMVVEYGKTDLAKLVRNGLSLLNSWSDKAFFAHPDGLYYGHGAARGKSAWLFPGQGSQYVGMGRDITCLFPEAFAAVASANGLGPIGHQNLNDYIYPRPAFTADSKARQESVLKATEVTQPALGAVGLGLARVLERFEVRPEIVAGHSFGELTALCAANRISPSDLHRLARTRGRLMADQGGAGGAMLAVLAPIAEVEAAVREAGLDLTLANKNTPTQVVLSGDAATIDQAAAMLQKRGQKTRKLEVSAAFHSPLVAQASQPFLAELEHVNFQNSPTVVYANTTAGVYPESDVESKRLLANQLASPVEFVREIEALADAGVTTFLEVGPDSKLTAMVGAILGDREHVAISLDASRGTRNGLTDLARTLAQVATLGHAINLTKWDEAYANSPEQTKKPSITVKVSGAHPQPAPLPAKPRPITAQPRGERVEAQPTASQNGPATKSAGTPAQVHASIPSHTAPTPTNRLMSGPADSIARNGTPANMTIPSNSAPRPQAPPVVATSAVTDALRAAESSLLALQKVAEQTAALHRQFLEGQDNAQRTFKTLLEHQQTLTLASLGLGQVPAVSASVPASPGVQQAFVPQAYAPQPVSPQHSYQPPHVIAPAPIQVPVPRAAAPAPVVKTVVETAPVPIVTSNGPSKSKVEAVVRDVVADKTGYPAEVLEPTMQLDADLGIDSIKRVEILAAVQERLPNARVLGPEHLGTVRTLGQIIDFLSESDIQTPTATVAHSGGDADEIRRVLNEVVADKTGYPAEVLEPTMQLDADLGIDSIKRVEILAAVQERLPNAPSLGAEHLGTIRTLGQIIEFLSGSQTQANGSMPKPAPASGSNAARVTAALMEVVSDKTGYPVEVLEPSMQLDADLGIDSIKRVEILAAVEAKLPGSPSLGPEHLGTIRTLGQIIDFLEGKPATSIEPQAKPVAVPVNRISSTPVDADVMVLEPTIVEFALESAGTEPVRGEIRIVADPSPLRESLLAAVAARGEHVHASSWDDSIDASHAAGLILVSPASGSSDATILQAFRHMRNAAGSLRASKGSLILVEQLDGRFGLKPSSSIADSVSGGFAGLAKTAAHEWPEVRCKAIDLDRGLEPIQAAELLLKAVERAGPVEIGINADGAARIVLKPETRRSTGVMLEKGDVIVISGGARGVTAAVAMALAGSFQPTLVLLGRSPAPTAEPHWLAALSNESEIKRELISRANGQANLQKIGEDYKQIAADREVAATIAAIESFGSRVVYYSVDIRDRAAVNEVVGKVRSEFGPIRGIIHGAGVLADRAIVDQTDEQFLKVYETKIHGLRALLDATAQDDLKTIVVFSSSTARFGRTGQIAYAAANEVMNKIAQAEARRRPACRVLAPNWGPWAGGMVTDALKPHFLAEGIQLIPLSSGARFLAKAINDSPNSPVEVVILGDGSKVPLEQFPANVKPVETFATAQPTANISTVFERTLEPATMPILHSHVIDGRPVLPLALTLEWLAQGALHRHPGMSCIGIDELKLLKGVVLRDGVSESVRVVAGKAIRKDEVSVVPVELRGRLADGRDLLHARAEVVLSETYPTMKPRLDDLQLPPYALSPREVYRDVLFHGPALQCIRAVEGCGENGIVARVASAPAPSTWIDKPLRQSWLTDPLVIDGAFQMLILWSVERCGAASLPTIVGRYRQFKRSFPGEGVRIAARITHAGAHKAVADIEFLDVTTGDLIARMDDYECVIDHSLNQAFGKNRPASIDAR